MQRVQMFTAEPCCSCPLTPVSVRSLPTRARWALAQAASMSCRHELLHRGGETGASSSSASPPLRSRAATARLAAPRDASRNVAAASASASLAGGPDPSAAATADPAMRFLAALYQFTRPHTMAGTTISILSISMLAAQQAALSSSMLAGLGYALGSALLMNISIVGTNQLYDIEIDKVNKPYLPLASGEFSVLTGNVVVGVCTLLSLAIGWASGSPALMATLVVSWLLGLAYSADLPFMRWKRSPVLAACCILSIRAIAVQLGFYWHMRHAMGAADALSGLSWGAASQAALALPLPVTFTVGFMLLFSIVIALFKDIPDAKGDEQAGLQTLTVRMGVAAPFWTCIWILTLAYVGACGYSVVTSSLVPGGLSAMPASFSLGATALPVKALISIFGHGVMAALLWWRALKVDLSKQSDITACYMHIWKLFYAEYILIPFFA